MNVKRFQKTFSVSLAVFLFVVVPLRVSARPPYYAELVSVTAPNSSTVSVARATSTDPVFITDISYNARGNNITVYCGTNRIISVVDQAVGNHNIPYSTPYVCTGALWVNYADTSVSAVTTFTGYSMSSADYDIQSGGGGGGGGGTVDITPHSFDTFNLFFGIILFVWGISYYSWFFRNKK